MKKIKNLSGFTFIELVIILLIFAISAVIAVPNFLIILNKQNLNKSSHELVSILAQARSIAVLEKREVTIILGLMKENRIQDTMTAKYLYWIPESSSFLKSGQSMITFMPTGLIKEQSDNQLVADHMALEICDQTESGKQSKTILISRIGKVHQILDGHCL